MQDLVPRQLGSSTLSSLDPRISVPQYQRDSLQRSIVHLGVGGFHRAHLAAYIDEVCTGGSREWSIVGSGLLPGDRRMAEALQAQDHLYSLVVKGADEVSVSVPGSIVDYILAADDTEGLTRCLADPDTRIASLTVTEGGYPIDDDTGEYDPHSSVAGPGSAFAILAEALGRRRDLGTAPITVLSCDNIMSNGVAARRATLGEAERIDPALASWIERNVAFPNSMVDRITPATSDIDRAWLSTEFGVADRWPVITEPFRQWVVEETFASEPPPLADLGVLFTSDVVPYEKLKLRLLNAGHSCLAYLSALLDIELVDQAMAEPVIHGYVKAFLDDEAGAVLPSVVGVDIDDYKQSLLTRFANPQVGDQISRLCLDGSAKFPKFLLPTVDALLEAGRSVDLSALALAGWCRYLMGRSESGLTIEPAGDPLLDRAIVKAKEADIEPRAFLGFEEVFPARLAQSPVFAEAFERSLTTLAHRGVRSAVDDALDRSTRTA